MTLSEIIKKLEDLVFELKKLEEQGAITNVPNTPVNPDEPTKPTTETFDKDQVTKSYGTSVYYSSTKVLSIFLDKGTKVKPGDKFYERLYIRKDAKHDIYALSLSVADINAKKNSPDLIYSTNNGRTNLQIGEAGDLARKRAENLAGLELLYEGVIQLSYLGNPVEIMVDSVTTGGIIIEVGVTIGESGFPKPYVANVDEKNHPGRMVRIKNGLRESVVKARDIEVSLK